MFISDAYHTISLVGLRWISKTDQAWTTSTEYQLGIAYKGQLHTLRYKSSEDRDAFYALVTKALQSLQVTKP